MAKKRTGKSRKTARGRTKAHKRGADGHIPIEVLEHRLSRLAQIVARRKGLRAPGVSLVRR